MPISQPAGKGRTKDPIMRPLILTVKDVRQLEKKATELFGIPSLLLMDAAGRGLASQLKVILDKSPKWLDVVFLCGGGNNGGDGFAAIRHLQPQGTNLSVYLTCPETSIRGDAAINYRMIRA